jgi:hypothetical protein
MFFEQRLVSEASGQPTSAILGLIVAVPASAEHGCSPSFFWLS